MTSGQKMVWAATYARVFVAEKALVEESVGKDRSILGEKYSQSLARNEDTAEFREKLEELTKYVQAVASCRASQEASRAVEALDLAKEQLKDMGGEPEVLTHLNCITSGSCG